MQTQYSIKKHTKTYHPTKSKYECKECGYCFDFVSDNFLHLVTKHPDELYKFSPKESENLLLTPIIEQNTMMREEMECMKKEVNAVF